MKKTTLIQNCRQLLATLLLFTIAAIAASQLNAVEVKSAKSAKMPEFSFTKFQPHELSAEALASAVPALDLDHAGAVCELAGSVQLEHPGGMLVVSIENRMLLVPHENAVGPHHVQVKLVSYDPNSSEKPQLLGIAREKVQNLHEQYNALMANRGVLDNIFESAAANAAWKNSVIGAEKDSTAEISALDRPIDKSDFSARGRTLLEAANVKIIGQLATNAEARILAEPNMGRGTLNEIRAILADLGLRLGMKVNFAKLKSPIAQQIQAAFNRNKEDSINELELDVFIRENLRAGGISTIGQLATKTGDEIGHMFSGSYVRMIYRALEKLGLTLGMEPQ